MHRLTTDQRDAFMDLLATKNLEFFDYVTISLYEEWKKEEADREFYQFKIDFLTMNLPSWIYELFNNLEYERA
jgi:hypothetical protein